MPPNDTIRSRLVADPIYPTGNMRKNVIGTKDERVVKNGPWTQTIEVCCELLGWVVR